jgi:hypothetical protein
LEKGHAVGVVVIFIVSRFPNETIGFGLQTFIVRFLIIVNRESHHIYIRTERRGKGLAAGETKRASV